MTTAAGFVVECDSKNIDSVQLYRTKFAVSGGSKKHKIRLYNVAFILAYIAVSAWMISTIGRPYREFLEKADREGFQVMEGSTKLRAELEHQLQDLDNPDRRTKKIGWFDWMDMDIEELAAEKKREKEKSVLDSLPKSMRVPHKHAVSFWPSLIMGVLVTLHALVLLMQHWSVGFKVWINYKELDAEMIELPDEMLELDEDDLDNPLTVAGNGAQNSQKGIAGSLIPDRRILNVPPSLPTHARVAPSKGRHVLLPIEYYPVLGMTFEYHRRRYFYDPENIVWSKIRCRTGIPLKMLDTWSGFAALRQTVQAEIRFGPNMFSVREPSFVELYKKQLLNPFSVFQIFCVLLWAIDDYITYSAFSLFSVLMFEATTVFQRLKALQALRGMGNPSRLVYVLRCRQWIQVDTNQLLPGDICSLTRVKPHHAKQIVKKDGTKDEKEKKPALKGPLLDEGGDIVPADLLLLRGSCVVNEASLTGESVPQMKEGLAADYDTGEKLEMKAKHKMNVAYAGTKMLQCKGTTDYLLGAGSDENKSDSPSGEKPVLLYNQIPPPPDQGCVCFVLRTGFSSAQGKLVRMMEGSQEKVKGHERETGMLLGLLCCFAIVSSGYVLYHGYQNENRSKYELLLHCILIITAVIRPELPMQMALAVNNSLMTLMKMHVFCTEPYRVPTAGKIDIALFDKTGTLTTDELVAVGVCEPDKLKQVTKVASTDGDEQVLLTKMLSVQHEAALVFAGCHSLVLIDEETTGDPLESTSLASMRWQLNESGQAVPKPATEKRPAGKTITLHSGGAGITQVEILTRHHFSSKLQRMSTVISTNNGTKFAVAKGSPEAVGKLLKNKPAGYDDAAVFFAKQGYRVIGLALRQLETESEVEAAISTRSVCESELEFAGFVAFTCMVRKDTASVLTRLKQGGMKPIMVTGDALLTAVHVAKEVGICETIGGGGSDIIDPFAGNEEKNEELRAFLESKRRPKEICSPAKRAKNEKKSYRAIALLETNDTDILYWKSYETGNKIEDYVAANVPALSAQYEMATSGKSLAIALEQDNQTGSVLQYFAVFARMTPDAKETVIGCLQNTHKLCLMCGDGANDVGALKQADVGVALLSGFGNLNVDSKTTNPEDSENNEKKGKSNDSGLKAIISREHMDKMRQMPLYMIKMNLKGMGVDTNKYADLIVEKEDWLEFYQIMARDVAMKRHEKKKAAEKKKQDKLILAEKQRAEMQEKQVRMMKRAQELTDAGESMAQFKAMKELFSNEVSKGKKMKAELARTRGVEGSAASLAAQLENMDTGDGLPMVKLGDASIAAPFTSKMPSIKSCYDIVRQGRCTLVSSIQMYQIMALQCLISSYSLSVLYLDGVKYGDSQMTAMGMLGTVSFMSVSRSKPLAKLSKVRPLSSLFHPALFCSLLGQFCIHLTTMVVAVKQAKLNLEEDFDASDLDGQFKPGILNTTVFLVSSVQQVTVFFVNLQGRPFMTGVTENRPLLWSLAATFILTFMFASESVPGLNRYFQLVPFPDTFFRDLLLTLLVGNLVLTFAWDRLMQFLFCRDILAASVEGTSLKDVISLARTFAIIGTLMYVFMGNSEQWDELLAMEQNLTAEENATTVGDCVGDACESINATVAKVVSETAAKVIHEEF